MITLNRAVPRGNFSMSHSGSPKADYCRYFANRQKVYLINISDQRDREEYESLSGIILECKVDYLEVLVQYFSKQALGENELCKFKINTESMGIGLQIAADLSEIRDGNVFCFCLHGILETYQRRQTPRVDAALKLYVVSQDFSLAAYRKEFKRIIDYRKVHGSLPNLKLSSCDVNISAGGFRVETEPGRGVTRLLMVFVDLEDGQPPVCALAETVWTRKDEARQLSGHRFIQILKSDQDRISSFVLSLRKQQGMAADQVKPNWELVDRMIFESAKSN